MRRGGLGPPKEATGVATADVANRMADYGVDPYWMSHEPWVVPEPFTPEAGEMYSKEDLDYWIGRSEEHTSELQSPCNLVCRLLLEKKKTRRRFSSCDTRAAQ